MSNLLENYRDVLRIRRLEEEAAKAYVQGKIGGFLHLYIGQEAIAVGTERALKKTDYVITTYRDHGFALLRGTSAGAILAELFGKATGCSKGLGGSMHMFDAANRFLGGHAIVGGHCALASGVAFRSKYLNLQDVCVCFFGEGATNIGGFHEALSLAGLWKLPVVFVCENNLYSMGTPIERTMPAKDLTDKAAGYSMARDRFDGQDVEVVRQHMSQAIERARKGDGPTLIEIITYRFRGHSMSDPGKYRTNDEVEERKKNGDPLLIAKAACESGKISAAQLAEVDAAVEAEIAQALAFAESSAPAQWSDVHETVLAPSSAYPERHEYPSLTTVAEGS